MRRPNRREDRRQEVKAHGQLSNMRVVRRVPWRHLLSGEVAQVLEEQAHHAALSLRPHHHLGGREMGV